MFHSYSWSKKSVFFWIVYEVYVQTQKTLLSSTKSKQMFVILRFKSDIKDLCLFIHVCSLSLVLWFLLFLFPLIIVNFTLFSSPYHLLLLSFWISYLCLQLFLSEGLFHSVHVSSFSSRTVFSTTTMNQKSQGSMSKSHPPTRGSFSYNPLPSVDVSSMHYCQSSWCLSPLQQLSWITFFLYLFKLLAGKIPVVWLWTKLHLFLFFSL